MARVKFKNTRLGEKKGKKKKKKKKQVGSDDENSQTETVFPSLFTYEGGESSDLLLASAPSRMEPDQCNSKSFQSHESNIFMYMQQAF